MLTTIHVPIRHLAPLFDNPKLDKELRAMLREKFPEFCSSPSPPVEGMKPSGCISCCRRRRRWERWERWEADRAPV